MRVHAHQGDTLDGLLWRHTGRTAALQQAVRLTTAGYGPEHSHTRRAEVSLARLRAGEGAADALLQLTAYGQSGDGDIEQRKSSWLARAYAAEVECRTRPDSASQRAAVDEAARVCTTLSSDERARIDAVRADVFAAFDTVSKAWRGLRCGEALVLEWPTLRRVDHPIG